MAERQRAVAGGVRPAADIVERRKEGQEGGQAFDAGELSGVQGACLTRHIRILAEQGGSRKRN